MCLYVVSSVLGCPFWLPHKNDVRLCLELFAGGPMSYLRYLCLFAHIDVKYILSWFCFACLCLVYPVLPVSLECPFVIAHSVFSNVYLSCVLCTLCFQFLWVVHFWIPIRYFLTFICPVSCVPYAATFSELSILDCPFGILKRLLILNM